MEEFKGLQNENSLLQALKEEYSFFHELLESEIVILENVVDSMKNSLKKLIQNTITLVRKNSMI